MFQTLEPSVAFDAVEDAFFRTFPPFVCYNFLLTLSYFTCWFYAADTYFANVAAGNLGILPEDVKRSLFRPGSYTHCQCQLYYDCCPAHNDCKTLSVVTHIPLLKMLKFERNEHLRIIDIRYYYLRVLKRIELCCLNSRLWEITWTSLYILWTCLIWSKMASLS